jgi:hypothetical protein
MASLGLIGFAAPLFIHYGIVGFDGPRFKALYACAFVATYTGIVISGTRLLVVWSDLRELLRFLASHPLLEASRRVPRQLAWEPMLEVSGHLPRFADLVTSAQYGTRSALALGSAGGPFGTWIERAAQQLRLAEVHHARAEWAEAIRARVGAQRLLVRAARTLSRGLAECWRRSAVPEAAPDGEVMLAARVIGLVRHVFAQIRALLLFLVVGIIGVLCATAAYPLQPKHHGVRAVGGSVRRGLLKAFLVDFVPGGEAVRRAPVHLLIDRGNPFGLACRSPALASLQLRCSRPGGHQPAAEAARRGRLRDLLRREPTSSHVPSWRCARTPSHLDWRCFRETGHAA